MKQKILDKLERVLQPELSAIEHLAIVKTSTGYELFSRYEIECGTAIKVFRSGNLIESFSSVRTALSWCIADKMQQHQLANEIMSLDLQVQQMSDDLLVREALIKGIKTAEYRENIKTKLENKKLQMRQAKFRLDKCVNLAKYWQIRGFNNETARTGRTPPYRTSR